MHTVTIDAAETNLSRLLARVEAGEEIVITRGKQPIARMVPSEKPAPKRVFGALKGVVTVDPGYFEPLPPEELDLWEG